MQPHKFYAAVAAIVFATAVTLFQGTAHAGSTPVGTAFSYQGQLKQGVNLVNSTADVQFSLWDGAGGAAAQVGTMQQIDAVNVVDGMFTVDLDFGPGMFEGEERWLQIAVRSPAGGGTFTTLSPRQALRASPQAQFALLSGGIADGGLPSTYSSAVALTNAGNAFSGSGAGLTNLNAASISTGVLPGSALGGTYSGALTFSNAGNAFTGSGAGLSDLDASNISAGTLANARTTGTATNTPNTLVLRDGSGNFSAGTITANGSGMTNLNASNIATGTLDDARLSASMLDRLPSTTFAPFVDGSAETGSEPWGVRVSGNHAYVVTFNTLQVFDVSDPDSPVLTGSVAKTNGYDSLTVSGNHAYVASGFGDALQVFDVSNPASPALVGSVATDASPSSVEVSGGYAYVLTSFTLQIFDVSNPASPALVGSVATGGSGDGQVSVSPSHAYVVNQDLPTLRVFNVSNPASPSQVGSLGIPGTNGLRCVRVTGGYAYVTTDTATLQSINVSNPAVPSLAGSANTSGNPQSITVSGDYCYVASISGIMGTMIFPLHYFDVSNPANPVISSTVLLPGLPTAIDVSGEYAYVTCTFVSESLQVVNRDALAFNDQIHAAGFNGSGSALTNLNASNLDSGTIGSSLLSGTYSEVMTFANGNNAYAGSGAGLTSLNASNIADGTIANARTSGTSANTPNTLVLRDASGNFSAGTITATHVGDGAGLTALNASNLASGAVPSARLGGAYSNALSFLNPANQFAGSFSGNGAGLTGLNAGAIVSGTIPGGALGGTYHNPVTFNNGLFFGTFSGDGLTITSLNANALVGGTVPGSRLSGPYPNVLVLPNPGNQIAGNGTQLTALNASNISTGTILNAHTTGASANTPNTLVLRDASGNFSAGTITANGSALTNLNASNISSGNLNSARMPTGGTWALSSTQVVTGPAGFVTAFRATSADYNAIEGFTNENIGIAVYGNNADPNGRAVVGAATGAGSFAVYAEGNSGASGTKSFQIDHPRDPENAYLLHYSAEGPEPFNLYRGNVTLDGAGEAWVQLPDYFQDINRDFHYLLTSIGAPSPNLHVALEIVNNEFMIAGGKPGAKVSWTVTAVRNDEYVRHYPTTDVREKPAALRGTYQHPEIFGQPIEKGEAHRRTHRTELNN